MSAWFDAYGCDPVAERLIVGAVPRDADDVAVLRALGVERVVSLVADVEYEDGEREAVIAAYAAAGIAEARVPSEDFGSLAPGTLEVATGQVLAGLREGRTVYLHCRAGWQRSVVTAAGVLARLTQGPPGRCVEDVRGRRRGACPLPHQVEDLGRWWAERGADAESP